MRWPSGGSGAARTVLVGMAWFAWTSCLVLADDAPEKVRERMRADQQRDAARSLDFLLALSLDAAQTRAVLPLHEQACRLHVEAYERQSDIRPAEIEAYSAFLAEDRLDQGFSPEVERRTARVHGEAIACREGLTTELNALADSVYALLTAEQRRIADTYKPDDRTLLARFGSEKDQREAARRAEQVSRHAALQARPDPELAAMRQELEGIQRAVHPHESSIAELVLTPAAAEALCSRAGVRPSPVVQEAVQCWRYGRPEYPLDQLHRDDEVLHRITKEINHWNLVNGMHFDPDQIQALMSLADQSERLAKTQREATPRDKLPEDVYNARLVELERAAESVLRPGQLEVLETYKPCLIPPKNLKDPVRVGQANDNSHLSDWLARAREEDPKRVELMIDDLIEGESRHVGPMDSDSKAVRRHQLRRTVRAASGMSDVEFAVNKNDLAASIQPEDRKVTLASQIEDLRRQRLQPGRTYQFLLNRDFAKVLAERGQQLVQGVPKGSSSSRTAKGSQPQG